MYFKNKKIISLFFYFLFFLILSFSGSLFYIIGEKFFGNDYSQYLFKQSTILADEFIYYFQRIDPFLNNLSLGTYEIQINNTFKFNDYSSLLLISLISLFFSKSILPMMVDIIIPFIFLIISFLMFRVNFNFNRQYSFACSIIFFVFFSYGITTLNYSIPLLLDFQLNNFPHIFRQFSPSISSIFFIGYFVLSTSIIKSERIKLINIFLIFLTYFSYGYSTLIQITFASLFYFYSLFFLKINKKFYTKLYIINFIFFLIWFLISVFQGEWHSKYSLDAKYIFDFNILKNFFLIFLFLVNLLIYFFYKKQITFIYLNIFILSLLIVYNIKFLLGYDMQLYHVDIYYSKPLQWINIFYIFKEFVNKKLLKFLTIFSIYSSVVFCYAYYEFSKEFYIENKAVLNDQLKNRNSFIKMKNILKEKTVHTLDLDFIMYGYTITDSYNYVFAKGRNINTPPIINLDRFLQLTDFHSIPRTKVNDMIFNIENFYANEEHNILYNILFLDDGNGIGNILKKPFRSLVKNQEIKNIKSFINQMKPTEKNFSSLLFLVNKFDMKKFSYKLNFDHKILYEDQRYILLEII